MGCAINRRQAYTYVLPSRNRRTLYLMTVVEKILLVPCIACMYVWIVQYQGFVNLSLWCQRGTINLMLEYHDRLISVTYLVESGLYEKCMFTHVNLLGSYWCMCDHGMTTHTSCWPTQWGLVSIYIIIVFPPFCASRKAWATVAPVIPYMQKPIMCFTSLTTHVTAGYYDLLKLPWNTLSTELHMFL